MELMYRSDIIKKNKNTVIFVIFLLLAGLVNMTGRMLPPEWDALFTCIHNVIYCGLLLSWAMSVRVRLLPFRTRTYVFSAACLMLFYMLLRIFKYRFATSITAERYVCYAYWVPQMLIPALFLMTCIRIKRGYIASAGRNGSENGVQEAGTWKEALIMIPAVILALMVMTNDLHMTVYNPRIDLSLFTVGDDTYSVGPCFYLLYVWMIITSVSGLIILFRRKGHLQKKIVLLLISDIALWAGIIFFDILFLYRYTDIKIFNVPEVNTFGMLGVIEICIQNRLIPYNENYQGFFHALKLPVLITDRKFRPAYSSNAPVKADADDLKAAVCGSVLLQDDQKLSCQKISAGYAFWVEDESSIRRAQEQLKEANETIELENDLLRAETEQKEKEAYLRMRHRIYHEIAEELYPCQRRIGQILNKACPGTERFRESLISVAVLNAYIKRKTNLLLLSSEKDVLGSYELYLAIEESAGYLEYAGLKVSVNKPEEKEYPSSVLIAMYDAFEIVAEQLLGKASSLMAAFTETGLRLAAETEEAPDASKIHLPVYFEQSDGILYMDIMS